MHFDDEEHSGSDSDADDRFNEDMEALRRACLLAGTDPNDLSTTEGHGGATTSTTATTAASSDDVDDDEVDDDDAEDDIELVRNLQKRFANLDEPLTLMPLCSSPPEDSCEDDFETLRAIQRRFAAYTDGGLKESAQNSLDTPEQVGVTNKIASEMEASNNLFVERNNDAEEGFTNCVDTDNSAPQNPGEHGDIVGTDLVERHESGAEIVPALPFKASSLPKPALAFVDAVKKNRSCQKVIRSKLMQIEARIEEIRKLKERVKILKDFQVGCKKRTTRALSQKKDARVQLISAAKEIPSSKLIDKRIPAMYYGPSENPHAAIYREVLTRFPVSVIREKWSNKEKENLAKGLKQQFQEMLLQQSVNILNHEVELSGDASDFDQIIASIRDRDITPQNIRSFLPKVNWEQMASMYVPGHSGAECQARWLNCEDPLINHNPWTNMEEKNLLHIIQQKGLSNWIDTAVSLGTNRTPFQCLARYQRSLNASIIRRDWTKEEDDKLRAAVEEFGEKNWQAVASVMEARTGTQCSNRWKKSLHPARKRTGRWTPEEDKRLRVAVKLFGAKSWSKIAEFVPGRMQAQCRERWVNKLDPNLNLDKWTVEEDFMLEEAIKENGYSWSKVAAFVPRRTDNQCRRRWMTLFPEEVPLLRAAKRTQKIAFISNFVDRESERPALGPDDFLPLPAIDPSSKPENANPSAKKKIFRQRRKCNNKDASTCNGGSEEVPGSTNGTEGEDGQKAGTFCGDLVNLAGEGSRQQKRKSVANDDTRISGGDGMALEKKRRKLKSNRKRSEGTKTAECCVSSLPKSTNGTEGENVQDVGTSCGDIVNQAGEGSRRQKRKSVANDETRISGGDGMALKRKRRKLNSNSKRSEGTKTAECCVSSLPKSTNGTEGENVQDVGTSCGDIVNQAGEGSRRQKRKSVANDDTCISGGDGMALKKRRRKLKSNRKKGEGANTAESCLSSLLNSTNGTEGENVQEVGKSCGDVAQAGEGSQQQKEESVANDNTHISVRDGMALKNTRRKLKSNRKRSDGTNTAECCPSSLPNLTNGTENVQEVGICCGDLVTREGEGSQQQKGKFLADANLQISVGDGTSVKNKRKKLKSDRKRSEGTNTAECCLSSLLNLTNGTEGEDVREVGTCYRDLVTRGAESSQQQKGESLADDMAVKNKRGERKSTRQKNEGGTSCRDFVTQAGEAPQQQKRKSMADDDIHISVGDGIGVRNKRRKSISSKIEGANRAECCLSSSPNSTNGNESGDGQEFGTFCRDLVAHGGEGPQQQKRKRMADDDIDSSVGDGMVAKNTRKYLKSNRKINKSTGMEERSHKRKGPKSNRKRNDSTDAADYCSSSLLNSTSVVASYEVEGHGHTKITDVEIECLRNKFAAFSITVHTPSLSLSHLGENNSFINSRIASETDAAMQHYENDEVGEGPEIQPLPPRCVQPGIPESGNCRPIVPIDRSGDGVCASKITEAEQDGTSLASSLRGSDDPNFKLPEAEDNGMSLAIATLEKPPTWQTRRSQRSRKKPTHLADYMTSGRDSSP